MKLFHTLQEFYQELGLKPPHSNRNSSATFKSLLIFLVLIQGFVATITFCVFKANTVQEYGDSFYIALTELTNSIYCYHFILNMRKIYQLIEKLERFVEKSESSQLSVVPVSFNIIFSQIFINKV